MPRRPLSLLTTSPSANFLISRLACLQADCFGHTGDLGRQIVNDLLTMPVCLCLRSSRGRWHAHLSDETNPMTRLPTLFLSHGGGPWPFMEDRRVQYAKTAQEFGRLPQLLPERPKAVLVITGHWEADAFTVSTSAHPPMVYDYYGFPEHTYHLKYPAPGRPELAAEVKALLARAGLDCREDANQGFDHGTFVPLG